MWTATDIAALVCTRISSGDWRAITAVAVVLAESRGNPLALGKFIIRPGHPSHLSLDVGMFQLNTYYQMSVDPYPSVPRITWADAVDPFKAWEHVWKLINVWRTGWSYNWTGWTAFKTDYYRQFITEAYLGMAAYRKIETGAP
jgi:hypothetical protein